MRLRWMPLMMKELNLERCDSGKKREVDGKSTIRGHLTLELVYIPEIKIHEKLPFICTNDKSD